MKITPNSTLYLLKNVPLDINNNFTLDFNNINQQNNFFDNLIDSTFDINEGYNYIRDTQSLKVQANCDDLFGLNYLYFMNNNKRYYAFITKKDYINPNCTAISFKIDVLQSFMFDYSIDESFVEREHQDRFTSDLKPIYNTHQENLEIGKNYEVKDKKQFFTGEKDTNQNVVWYYIYAKEPLGKLSAIYGGEWEEDTFPTELRPKGSWQGLSTGFYVYLLSQALPVKAGYSNAKTIFMDIIAPYIESPKVVKIVASRYCPKNINWSTEEEQFVIDKDTTNGGVDIRFCRSFFNPDPSNITNKMLLKVETFIADNFGRDYVIEDIIKAPILSIENKKSVENEPKLNTAPYSLLRLNLFNKYANLERENFKEGLKFRLTQGIGNVTNLVVQPLKYLGEDNGNFSIIKSESDNQINLRTDAWENYQSQNSASINGGLAVAGAQIIGGIGMGIMTGGFGLAMAGQSIVNFAGQVGNKLLKEQDIKNTPDEVVTTNDSFTPVLFNEMLANIEFIEIKENFKNIVFNYFFHYGYKCNEFKKPNVKSRYYFNYIKTIGANIKSNIDNDFITEIRIIFDNGITIWHYRDSNTFKGVNNYDYENMEISLMEDPQ